uniref:Uncharacterized protein n=1 Tax=Arundo donax TaxID=35708 RepID=A0A0A8ZYA2_ARUDO
MLRVPPGRQLRRLPRRNQMPPWSGRWRAPRGRGCCARSRMPWR